MNPHLLLVGMWTGTATMENRLVLLQKIKKLRIESTQQSSPEYLPEELKNIYSQSSTHPYVHCSISHSGQGMETTSAILGGLDKKMWHIYAIEY